jgi:hypothetical protein
MSDVEDEFNRLSETQKRAVASSWDSFLYWAEKVVIITVDVLRILHEIWKWYKGRN